MEPPALAAGPVAPVRAAPGASADLVLPPPRGTQPFTYHWSRAGAALDDRFTTSDDAGGVRLTVSAAQTGDSGVYTLQASNAAGSDSSKIWLEVAAEETPTGDDPPTFLRRLQDLTVKVGSRTRFLVEIISSTECKVTWYRNERRLLEAERVALARDGNFWCADVAAVSVDDAGRWTCTAENVGGRASCSAHLNVLVPKAYKRPEFVEELRALLTEQGTVSLECKVVGVPTPVLRWFKDSREIKAGDVFALTANAEDPTSLGTYTCEAVNCMGRAYSSSKVHVVGRASREGSARPSSSGMTPEPPPIFTKELEDTHVKICDQLTLGCHIVVPPWPRSVLWYNKEGKVEPGERYHALEDGVGGYLLEIPSAEWADEGEWKCVATSTGGRVGITTCYVTMDVPKNYRKPRFMENLQAVLTEEGLVSFECKVVGFPTPVLSWFKDGQELKPGDVYQLTGTNSLGSYCCIARNCMGQASSSAELTVEDIQNQLNEEEKLQLFSKNQAPKFMQGLKSVEAKIDEPFRFTVKVAIPPEPSVLWYRDDQPVDESTRCHLDKEDKGLFNLDIQNLEFLDQAEWKCVAINDFGHSVTSCFLKLVIPRHYKKPRFLENLQAILSDEGAVNLECKVIGVPQPVLKWYKDGEELKPGDIHRIISGQDGTCCLGTYTCEAQNCMGIAASSASLLGFDDSMKAKAKKVEEQALQRNLSLSTIHEERTSQMYDTPIGDITLDDKGEISFSFDGKEVSVSLYETPDLTEEEALQIVEMYADQLSENVTEHNVVELPPLRFVKETSTSGNLLMEAIIIDVSPEYFAVPDEDLRTEADVEDLSIAEENGPPQISLDQDIEIGGEDYLEKTMALLSDEKSDFAAKSSRKKSDSQRSVDDFFSLSRDQSLSEEKRDDDTHVSESDLQSFASARSSGKIKSKSSKPSGEDGQESSEPTKTILFKEEIASKSTKIDPTTQTDQDLEVPITKLKRERRTSRGSRRSSTSSEKSISKSREELLRLKKDVEHLPMKPPMNDEEFKNTMNNISASLTKVINDVQLIERDIILKSELMSSAATASRSLEIISSLITPLSEIHSIADAAKESVSESREVTSTIFNGIPQPLKALQQSLTIIEKCISMESDNKTLVKKTCVAFIESCGTEVQKVISDITSITAKDYILFEDKVVNEIDSVAREMTTVIKFSAETVKARNILTEASEMKSEESTLESKHMRDTQKALFELKCPLSSLLRIVESAESGKLIDLAKIKNSDVIMNDMSASIQDLQMALEQIESLSVKESSSSLQKYNTEIIETVMDSVLKLRGSFELLSTEPNIEEDKTVLIQTLSSLKENLTEISCNIEAVDKNVGQFDVLLSENKLDVLQKMAQILIALENNLPRLEAMPEVKSHMDTFHKSLTKVLEKVIESNDAKKYLTMMEICNTIKIINSSIKNLDSENVLPLASLSNTLKIIETHFINNIFESELNCSIMNNISDVLVGIQEAINKAEEISLQIDSEYIQDFSTEIIDEAKVNIILEHIDQTIAAVNTIKTIECTQELKLVLKPALENICPILEELKRSVASVRPSQVEQDEHVSEISETTFALTIATPLCELNQNIIVLNQLIVENIDSIKENTEVVTAIAEPLHELFTTLEILQQDVISQYGDDLTPFEVSVNMASVVQNLQSCIVLIHEQAGIEGADEMSTLEDISGIKTSAETLPSDRLVLPTAEETAIEQSLSPFTQEVATTATAQTLQTLNEHIMVLQTPEVIETLDSLSEVSDYSTLKSVALTLGDLHTSLEGILHPVPIEGSIDLEELINISKLAAIAEPMQEIQQSLSVLDTTNIPIYENLLDMPAEKIHSVFQSITEFKNSLGQCMCALLPAMEIANNTIEISNKVSTLREVCEQLKEIFETSKDASCDPALPTQVQSLEIVVDSLIEATDVSKEIKIDQVKCITEELYLSVMNAQEEIIQFTAQSPEKISQEAKLIQIVSEVEKNIAVLEQYDFIDLSHVSDITARMSPQIAMEIDSDSLAQIHDIAENAVNVLHDSSQEIPIADLSILEDFFKTCKNEFTILRCLICKATSHKKIIRLLQEFNSLQKMINDFTTKRLELRLSDDVNECLTNFLILADECLRNARNSLIKVIDTQSDMLIKIPVTQLESMHELKFVMESKTNDAIENVVKILLDVAETSKSLANHLQCGIIAELSQPNQILSQSQEEIVLTEKIEEIALIVDAELQTENLDNYTQKILQKLATCINKHHVYKDATGTGKTLLILKCLAECTTILQEEVTQKKLSKDETSTMKGKENTLKEVLVEMLQPLQALQTQLVNIREQVLTGADKDSISIDTTTTESIMQVMTELHKDIVQQIELDKSTVDYEDISLIMEVDKEIHSIQDSIKSMENVQAAQAVKEITRPMEDIEKSLNTVLSSDKVTLRKETLLKESTAQILNHIDQYIELIEIVEEISAIIKIENVKETFNIAQKLRESIAASENIPSDEQSEELLRSVRAEQTRLAQELQTTLSILQIQVLDSAQELAPVLSTDALQRISQVTAQLQAYLVTVTGVQIAVQASTPLIETRKPATQEHYASASLSESVGADVKEIMILEQVHDVNKNALKEQVEVINTMLEKKKILSQEPVVAKEVDQQESSEDITSLVTPHLPAGELTKESFVEIGSLETANKMEIMTEMATVKPVSENIAKVEGHILETPQQSVEEREEELVAAQDNLMQHIHEYVSEDVIEVVNELSSLLNAEELKQSINIAKELCESIAAIETGTKEEVLAEIKNLQRRQVELIQGLQTALSVLNEQTLENLHELVPRVKKSTLEKVATVTDNLKTDLEIVMIYQQQSFQSAQEEQREIKTELKTAQLVKHDVAENLEQALLLNEETDKIAVEMAQTTVEAIRTLMLVAPTSEPAVVADQTKSFEQSKVLDEFTSEVTGEVEEVVSNKQTVTLELKPDIAAEHADILLSKEITMQSESHELDDNVFDQAIVTELVGPVVSKEEISEHIELTQKVVQIDQDEHKSILEAELDSSTVIEEHVVPVHKVDAKVLVTGTATVSQSIETVTDTTPVDKVVTQTAQATEHSVFIQHLDAFISEDVAEIVNEISNIINSEELKKSVDIARKLRESVMAADYSVIAEEASPMHESNLLEQAYLAQTLQDALLTLHTQTLDSAQLIKPIVPTDALQRVYEIISHLQDDLTTSVVFKEAEEIIVADTGDVIEIKEQNSMAQLETLLQDVNIKINLTSTDRTTDADDFESLRNTLDEVQTVIIKLKREYDGTANDALNETLEDLECSVRSVQLQINEESPPELLTEACATLQLLVDNMTTVQHSQTILKSENTEKILARCSNETEETVKLLDEATKLDPKGSSNLMSIVINLNTIRDSLKSLRENFLIDADTVIENGVKVVQCLDQIEENIFSLEREVEFSENITIETRDSIITAVHSVYGSISNMRSTVSSVQKRYMFENYGKPSESLLHSIKNIGLISSYDDEENRVCWKRLSKSLRKVLNHFEDIKFYINLDKTARIPSDAAFTKIILEELKNNVLTMSAFRAIVSNSHVIQKVNQSLICVQRNLISIESDSSLEVKNKIPMFKDIASEMLTTTTLIKSYFEKAMRYPTKPSKEPLDGIQSNNEIFESNQDSATVQQQADSTITVSGMPPISKNEIFETEIVNKAENDKNVPSTSHLNKDDVTAVSVKYVTQTEVTIPFKKQASVLEIKLECSSSESFENFISDTSTNLEETINLDFEPNQTEVIIKSLEMDKLNKAQTSQTVVIIDNISSKASTSQEKKPKVATDEETKAESLGDKAKETLECCVHVERKTESDTDINKQHAKYSTQIVESSEKITQHIQKHEKQNDDRKSLENEDSIGIQEQLSTHANVWQEDTVADVDTNKAMQTHKGKIEKEVEESLMPTEEAIPLKQETQLAKNQEKESFEVADIKDVPTTSLGIKNTEKLEQRVDILEEARMVEDRKEELYKAKDVVLEVKESELSQLADDSQMETDEGQKNEKLKQEKDIQDKEELEPKQIVDEAEIKVKQFDETRIKEEKAHPQKEEVFAEQQQKNEDDDEKKETDKTYKKEMELQRDQKDEDQVEKKKEEREDKIQKQEAEARAKTEEEYGQKIEEKAKPSKKEQHDVKNTDVDKAEVEKDEVILKQRREEEFANQKEEETEIKQKQKEESRVKPDEESRLKKFKDEACVSKIKGKIDEKNKEDSEQTHTKIEEDRATEGQEDQVKNEREEEGASKLEQKSKIVKKEDVDEAKKENEENIKQQLEVKTERLIKETETEEKQDEEASVKKQEARLYKQQEEKNAQDKKEKVKKAKKEIEEPDKAERENEDKDFKQKLEESERDKNECVKEEESRLHKEQEEKDAQDKEGKVKKAKKEKEDADRVEKEKEEQELKQRPEEDECVINENELKQKQAEEVRVKEQEERLKKETDLKQKQDKEVRVEEEEARLKTDQEEKEARDKKDKAKKTNKETEDKAEREKEEILLKQNLEEEERFKKATELKQNQDENARVKKEDVKLYKNQEEKDKNEKVKEAKEAKKDVDKAETEKKVKELKQEIEQAKRLKKETEQKEQEGSNAHDKTEIDKKAKKTKVDTDEAKGEKEEMDPKQKLDEKERLEKENELKHKQSEEDCVKKEEVRLHREQEERDAQDKKEKVKKSKKEKEDADKAQREKEEQELKQNLEEEERLKKETELKQKQDKEVRIEEEEARLNTDLEEKDSRDKKEKTIKTKKETEDADKTEREKEEILLKQNLEEKEERLEQATELKQKQDEKARVKEEYIQLYKDQEEKDKNEKVKEAKEEKEDVDKSETEKEVKQEIEEEERLKIESEQKEQKGTCAHDKKEIDKKAKTEKLDTEEAKREKKEMDLKQNLEDEERLKKENELKQNQNEEARVKEEEARFHKKQEENDFRDKKKNAEKAKKEKEDADKAKRGKEEIDIKQKLEEEKEERLNKETELEQKQDEEARVVKIETRLHTEQEENEVRDMKENTEKAKKEKEKMDLKQKLEENERVKKENELKQKQGEEARVKEDETRVQKEEKEKDALGNKEKVKKAQKEKKEKELEQKIEEERLKKENELKQKQDKEVCVKKEDARLHTEQEKKVALDKKEKEDADRAEREKEEQELKQRLEEDKRVKNENELKHKQDEEVCVKKEEARFHTEQEEEDARNKKETAKEEVDKAEREKVEKELKQKLEEEELVKTENELKQKQNEEARVKEEEARLQTEQEQKDARDKKEKQDADKAMRENVEKGLKQKLEEEECVKIEHELKQKQAEEARVKEEEARLDKEQEEKDARDKKEKVKKAQREKEEQELKQQLEEKELVIKENELNKKQTEETCVKEEKARIHKEQEEKDARDIKEKNKKNKKEKEDADQAEREKEKQELKQLLEEEERVKKENELKQKQAEEVRVKEEEARLLKEQEEKYARDKKENAKKAKKEKEDSDKAEKEKEEQERKQQLEEKELVKKENELKQKQAEEACVKEEEARIHKEQVGKDARDKKEKDKKTKKEKEDADKAEREKEKHELKQQIEEEERVKKEDELKQKQAEEVRVKEEETRLHKKQEEKDAQDNKERPKMAKKEKDEKELKQNLEDEERVNKENKLKQKQAEEALVKEEEARLHKELEEKDARDKKEKVKKAQKEKEDADKREKEEKEHKQKLEEERLKKETELKQKLEEDTRAKKEEEDRLKKEIEESKRKQKEEEDARSKKEKSKKVIKDKEDDEVNKKEMEERKEKRMQTLQKVEEVREVHDRKEKEDAERKQNKQKDTGIKKEKVKKTKKLKEETFRVEKEEDEMELKQKQIEEETEKLLRKNKDDLNVNLQKESEKRRKKQAKEVFTNQKEEENYDKASPVKTTQTEKGNTVCHDGSEPTKKNDIELVKKATKYTEKLVKTEKRDDEIHIYTIDTDKQVKKENGDVNLKSGCEVSHEQHYFREYQYEPSQIGHKIEAREKLRFVDHNHRDYTMEFARPTGYRERSFDVDKTDGLPTHDQLGRNAAIYRAQTIVLDAQLRSSAPPYQDTTSSRTPEPTERRPEIRHRSKALSEARSVISEKRTSLSRDTKRKPVFSTYLTDRTAVEGSRVKLTCSVLSSSDPTVTWYKNGVLLENKLKYRTKYMDGLITLEVLNAVPSDSAEYSCTIQNENGSVNSSANLKVYPSFEASPIPPTFTRSIRDTYHLAENELVLECRIRGQPLPAITWLKDERSICTNSRYQAYYLADGVCRLAIEHPTPEDSGKYTCKAENSVWSDQITHVVNFTGRESRLSPNIATIEKSRFNRQALESRRPHFTNVLSDYKVVQGGTIGLQVEIRGAPTRVEWLREGCSVTEIYRNAKTFVEQGLYTLALSDVTEKESGMYTCRAWSSQCHVDMNAAITVVQPNELDGKPAIIIGRPEKDILISVGEDVNISFRVQGEPRPKVIFMKGIRDITTNQRVCKMNSDDYVKFTLKRSVVSDAGTYCILARNAYGCDRAFVTVVVRQRASSENLISDWTYPIDDSVMSIADRRYKSVPERIPGVPSLVEGGNNWISLGWSKSEPGPSAPVLAYKLESWLLGKEGGARWVELGITPLNSFDVFNLKQGEEYHFRVTPRNRYGWGESVQTSSPIGVGLAGDRPEFSLSLPGQLKVLVGETANLSCRVKGKPVPEVVWMKNGHEIEDDDKRLSSSFNGFDCCLIIKDINIVDEARYSCEATNVHGRASTYARLAVVTDRSIWEADAKLKRERSADAQGDYPPQFTMRLRDRRVQATYPVRLTCQVIGSPAPSITWFKDGEEVKPDSRRSHFQDEHFHTLEIAPTMLEDGGVYEAMARNNSGAVSCHCSLVVDKGIRAYVAPEFCCGLEPLYRLSDGEELRISAVVEAYPSVGVTWYRDGVRLRPSRRAIMTLDRDGQIELALAAVTSRDAGVYTCTASNEVGRASTSGKVEVTGTNAKQTPPVFISPHEPYSKEPMFIRKPRSSEAREGDTVIIACEVVGDPKPDVYWLRDFLKPDYYRDSSHFKRMGDGPEYRFEIPHAKLDYTGAYSVVARNQHGEAKAVISLQILAKDLTSCDEAHNVRYGRVEVLPRFTKELTDLLSCDGDAVQFECRLSGNPEPHVRWFHYNELIRECPDFETSFAEGTARMKIKQVTAEDEGTYRCEAANNLGKANSSACLVVYPPGEPNTLSQRLRRPPAFLSAASTPRSTPRSTPARSVSRTPGPETRRLCSPARTLAPSFYTYPFNKVVEEGDPVTLQCAIKGNPAPWATWDKDGVIITPSSRITIKEKDDVLRILEIDQVTIEDVGVYRITIENEFGRQEATARIEMITQKGKFYAGVRAVSPSPRKSLTYRSRRPSTPRQD